LASAGQIHLAADQLVKANAVVSVVALLIGAIAAILLVLTRWQAVHLLPAEWFYRVLTAHGLSMLIFFIIFFEMAVLHFTSTALINARVARVVAALRDPNLPAARGGEALAAARIRFEHGLMEDEAREINIGFLSRVTRGRPWVRLKAAATLDGRTALSNGASQWITGAEARRDGHRWRARACALLTGIGTVKADDPQLTVREVDTPRQPLRVVIDSRLETPPSAKILQGGKVLIFAGRQGPVPQNADVVVLPNANGKVELPRMLEELARRGINELHVEAGFRLNGSLVREGCVDELLLYLNPSLLGDGAQGMFDLPSLSSLRERISLRIVSLDRVGEDLRLIARPA
jgi:diaminohydroxyphosphoribosylaminopyrimidine deaminase/5-amino-6-(5-phosphoribosylamino)uracil reductase